MGNSAEESKGQLHICGPNQATRPKKDRTFLTRGFSQMMPFWSKPTWREARAERISWRCDWSNVFAKCMIVWSISYISPQTTQEGCHIFDWQNLKHIHILDMMCGLLSRLSWQNLPDSPANEMCLCRPTSKEAAEMCCKAAADAATRGQAHLTFYLQKSQAKGQIHRCKTAPSVWNSDKNLH